MRPVTPGAGRGRFARSASGPTEGGITIDDRDAALPLTGERTAPGVWHEQYWYARHLAAYEYLLPHCAGRSVLDAGCGSGYGAALVRSAGARRVAGLDYDAAAVAHAARRYPAVAFGRANLVRLPLVDDAVDVLLSLQVVEHIWTPQELLAEAARVLRPGGVLAMSTPNRRTFSPGLARGARPTNPFHVRELDGAELVDLVGAHLRVTRLLGVHAGPRLRGLDRDHAGLVRAQLAVPPQQWDAALARDVRSVTTADFAVSERDVDDSLDLLVLAEPVAA